MADDYKPWADPAHPGNTIRPKIVCVGCGVAGCTTAWGPWCFKCNVERITRINKAFDSILGLRT